MRIAILSDIHSNLIALERVLDAVASEQPDQVWCLGDVVGYGPHPQACVDQVQARAQLCLAGNHDLAVAGQVALDDFNDIARGAVLWQRQHLSAEALAWLAARPSRHEEQDVTLAHASPRDPVWEYIDCDYVATANFPHFQTQICLVGHTHLAIGWRNRATSWRRPVQRVVEPPDQPLFLNPQQRWLLNPGSVGQPRDRDPRAAYALLDLAAHTWTWRRLAYDIDAVAAAIQAAGLHPGLGQRLYHGV